MRFLPALLLSSILPVLSHAQEAPTDATFLKQARTKYDAPFQRNLQSFDCAVDFDWKQHFKENVRVGDEGTDEEIQKVIQPLHTRVTVTPTKAVPTSGMTDDETAKLPRGGMAELLLEHAVQFSLNNWLGAANNAVIPPDDTAVHVESLASGYSLSFKLQTFDVELIFTPDMRLESEGVKGSANDRRLTDFHPGPNGFVLSSLTMGEDGNLQPGHRIILTYTYQTVDGFQLPSQVSVQRESHHENWHYKLSDCKVKTST